MQRAQQKKRKQQQQKLQQKRQKQSIASMADLANDSLDNTSSGDEHAAPESGAATEPASSAAAAAAPASSKPSASASFVRGSSGGGGAPNPFVRVKPGNFSRLLYTNPVCLLTTSLPTMAATTTATVAAASSGPALETATASAASTTESAPTAAAAAAVASSVTVAAPPAPTPALNPTRNVMTISWLTATSNHGEFVASMNAGRFSAKILAAAAMAAAGPSPSATAEVSAAASSSASSQQPPPTTGAAFVGATFVLSVPVAGMEGLVKAVGGCSGGDEDASGGDKFARLGITPCRPGNKPILPATAAAAASASSSSSSSHPHVKPHRPSPHDVEDSVADADDARLNLLAIPGCAAHMVCQVVSACPAVGGGGGAEGDDGATTPRVQAHNILFCRVTRAYVHKGYWANGNNFIATTPNIPPYLTFLGSGNFGHVTNPEHSAKKW